MPASARPLSFPEVVARISNPLSARAPLGALSLGDQWMAWASGAVQIDGSMASRYTTSGSTEAIREFLLHTCVLPAAKRFGSVHLFRGDGDRCVRIARALGLAVYSHPRLGYQDSLLDAARPGDALYVSQPSSIDGNLWPGFEALTTFLASDLPWVRLLVDLSLVGLVARPYLISTSGAAGVAWSLSQAFGVLRLRIGGLLSERPIASLELDRNHEVAEAAGHALMSTFAVRELALSVLGYQASAVAILRQSSDLGLLSSDVVSMGQVAGNCWCLTDLMELLMKAAGR